ALYEARRMDLDVNASEAAMLSVLRQELRIAQVEHFLLEHHAELREFWHGNESFAHELNALRSAGVVFGIDGKLIMPDDVVPAVRQVLGVDMSREAARRVFEHLSGQELTDILDRAGCRSAGTREVKI